MGIECPQCEHDNPDDSIFCEGCGSKLQAATRRTPAAAPATRRTPAAPQVLYTLNFKDNTIEVSEDIRTFGRQDFVKHIPEDEYKFVSRKHFTITMDDDKFYIKDEGTANGTKLNGTEIKGEGKRTLKDGSKITLGDTVDLKFNVEG